MIRFVLLLMVLLSGVHPVAAQQTRRSLGAITSAIKLEEIIFGHLVELNGKFKLRATEVTFAPDALPGSASLHSPSLAADRPAQL